VPPLTRTRIAESATTVVPLSACVVSVHLPGPRRTVQVKSRERPRAVMRQVVRGRMAPVWLRAICTARVARWGRVPVTEQTVRTQVAAGS
jgi:hypothetical protein